MGEKRINVGIYIRPEDIQIAEWFNLLKRNDIPFAKWIAVLLAGYHLKLNVDIGALKQSKPDETDIHRQASLHNYDPQLVFGSGHSQLDLIDASPAPRRYAYGSHIRDENGNYTYYSTIVISIYDQAAREILYEIRNNGRNVSTFIKALIRKNLKYESVERAPSALERERIITELVISNAEKESRYPRKRSKKRVSVKDNTDKPAPAVDKPKTEPTKKNPLMKYVK